MPVIEVPTRRHFDVPATELRAEEDSDSQELVFRGHAAVFDVLSEDLGGFREQIAAGAFSSALDRNDDVRFLINHGGLPLARTRSGTLQLREDPRGLHVDARVRPSERTRELRDLVARGDIDQMSFAFEVAEEGERWEVTEEGETIRTVLDFSRLWDVSTVTFPAYPQTDAQMRRVEVPTSPRQRGQDRSKERETIGQRLALARAKSTIGGVTR